MRIIMFMECQKNDTAAMKATHKKFLELCNVLGLNLRTGAALDGNKAKFWYIIKGEFSISSWVFVQLAMKFGGVYLLLFDLEISNFYTLKPNGQVSNAHSAYMDWERGLLRLIPQGVNAMELLNFATDGFGKYCKRTSLTPQK